MKARIRRLAGIAVLIFIAGMMVSCDNMQVYGGVSYSTYSGGGYYHGGPSYGTSISVGGRIR